MILRRMSFTLFLLWFGAAHGKSEVPGAAPIKAVCTTTHLSSVMEAVGGTLVDIRTIVPFGMCPGHFDVSPGEVERVRKADVVLAHGYERFLNGFGLDVSAGADGGVRILDVPGNWMIPDVHKKAAAEAAGLLTAMRPDAGSVFLDNLAEYERRIDAAVAELEDTLDAIRGTMVVCAEMNREFVEWTGVRVGATIRRDEDVSVKAMHDIILAARGKGVKIVIDNRQSSGRVGETIARELKVPLLVLGNFPENPADPLARFPYIETLKRNCIAIREALN